MVQRRKAVYHEGKLELTTRSDLPEGAEVEVAILGGGLYPPEVTDPLRRHELMVELVKRMRSQLLSPAAPRLTRGDLHDRG